MSKRWLSKLLLVLTTAFCFSSSFVPGDASAQDDPETRRDEAKKLADSAFDLLENGLYDEAIDLFVRADERFHSPVFLLFVAEAYEKKGDLVEARRYLKNIVDEKLAEYAPASFRDAQNKAKERAVALDERIPQLTINLVGSAAEGASVTVDGKAVSGTTVQLNPGKHRVEAKASAGVSDSAEIELSEGSRESVELTLDAPVVEDGGTGTTPGGDAGVDDEGGRNWLWPGIAFGVGGAGLIMGIAAGGVFVGKAGDLKDSCENDGDGNPDNCSAPGASDDGDSTKLVGNVATAGFVIAGVGIAAGVVLALVPLDTAESDSARYRLRVGPTGAMLEGRF